MEILAEERGDLVKGDQFGFIVQIHMAGPFHIIQFLGSLGPAVGVFAEFSGVGLITGDEQQGTGRNGLDILERIEVHELHIAGVGGMGGGVHILPFACCRTPGGPVEIVEFLLDGIGLLIQGMGGSPSNSAYRCRAASAI